MDSFGYWKAEGFFGADVLEFPPAKDAHAKLMKAQARLKNLPAVLREAKIDPDGPLPVRAYVEMSTAIGELHSAETLFVSQAILFEIQKLRASMK